MLSKFRVCSKSNVVPHVEQELPTPPEHLRSHPHFSGVRVARSLICCIMFCESLFFLFLLAIVLSVLRLTDYDYPVGNFKLFF